MASDNLAREAPAKCYGCGKPLTTQSDDEWAQAEIVRLRGWLYCIHRMMNRALNGEHA
jgi:hypothetical protein